MVRSHPSTPQQRAQWVSQMLAHQGHYGLVAHLSRQIGVSRQTLYTWAKSGRRALEHAFQPEGAAPQPRPALARQILELLVESHPRALSKTELQDRLWPGTFVVEKNLTNLVSEIREALGDDPATPSFIRDREFQTMIAAVTATTARDPSRSIRIPSEASATVRPTISAPTMPSTQTRPRMLRVSPPTSTGTTKVLSGATPAAVRTARPTQSSISPASQVASAPPARRSRWET